MLFETDSIETWNRGVDDQEVKMPGYKAFIEWLRGKCYPSYEAADKAFRNKT